MFRTAALSFAILSVAFTLGRAEDTDCLPPFEGGPDMRGERECCSAPPFFEKSPDMRETMRNCMTAEKIEMPEPPQRGSKPPSKPDDNVIDCMDQCACKSMGFVTADGVLDKDALKAKVAAVYTEDWATVADALLEECYASAASEVPESSTCKSGCRQFKQCFARGLFMKCPTSKWTESDQCTQFKQIYTKCEGRFPMFLMGHRPHGHHGHHGPPQH